MKKSVNYTKPFLGMMKIKDIILKQATIRNILILAMLYIGMLLLMLFLPNGIIELSEQGGSRIFDLRINYNWSEFNDFFATTDNHFIEAYRLIHLLDIPYAVLYMLLLISTIYKTKAHERIKWAGILPVTAFVFDMLENKFLSDCYTNLMKVSEGMVAMASTMTSLKWIAISASVFAILYARLTRKNFEHQHTDQTTIVYEEEIKE